jgi:chemotaxis protein methyltransferase CheR
MISRDEFEFLSSLVRDRAAIVLESGKEHLVEGRLVPVLRERQLTTAAELVAELRRAPGGELARVVVEAMTTNETSFFRDAHPFSALRETILPGLFDQRADERKLRFWSNACSSGQEAYSIAMLLLEQLPSLGNWDVSILATDISRAMVQRTQQGIYGQLEVNRGLPASLLLRCFQRHGTHWQVRPELRRLVQARELNLAQPWPTLPRFDVIMLRNVLSYFDLETRRSILRRARQVLRPDGFLFLGSAESTLAVDDSWERLRCGPAVSYRPLPQAAQHAAVGA